MIKCVGSSGAGAMVTVSAAMVRGGSSGGDV